MSLPADYWTNYERTVSSLEEFVSVAIDLGRSWPDRRFVWRGIANAGYALHSSLYRRLTARGETTEEALRSAEDAIFSEAREWWLQRTAVDRLSALELLAALQHQGVPTRLLDFSHNALVGLWFAIEQKRHPDGTARPDTDGRVFVAQSNGRQIAEEWARSPDLPWSTHPAEWDRDIFVWTPPPIDARMTRQQGCFVFGGVPSTPGGWNRSPPRAEGMLRQAEVRGCVSIPIRLNHPAYLSAARQRGRPPGYPLAFTLCVPAASKAELRNQLTRSFGYTHAMMYPDHAGFASFGRSIPRP